MGKLTVLWLLLAALNMALPAATVEYFTDGGQLTLEVRPAFPDPITNLLWKFNGNLLAEWIEKVIPLTYYKTFNGRSNLSMSTGQLVIKNMTKDDQGTYSVTINNKLLPETYTTKLIKTVRKPVVVFKPLTCSVESETCDASCDADIVGAEPVTYRWKKDGGEWKELERVIIITKTQDAGVKTLTCQIENPVSKESSEPIANKLYNPSPGPVAGIVGGVFVILLVIGAAVGLFVARKKKTWPFKDRSTNSTDVEPGNAHPANHADDDPAKPTEILPLNSDPQDLNSDDQEP